MNEAIRALGEGDKASDPKSVSFQLNPTVCGPVQQSGALPTSAASASALASAASASAMTGPFVRVYGEDVEAEGTQHWAQRAESTSHVLYALLLSLGVSPDELIPPDTFDEDIPTALTSNVSSTANFGTTPATAAIYPQPMQSHAVVTDLTSLGAFASDGMTDEELERYLAGGGLE